MLDIGTALGSKPTIPFAMVTSQREREGWPLLTVETEVNGDSKSTNDRDPSLVGCWFGWTHRASTKIFGLPWLL
jgi:hypothetical protein